MTQFDTQCASVKIVAGWKAIGYANIVCDNVTPRTIGPVPDQAKRVLFSCEEASARYRFDGGDPTPDIGHLIMVTWERYIDGYPNIVQLKFIATGLQSTIRVTFLEGPIT